MWLFYLHMRDIQSNHGVGGVYPCAYHRVCARTFRTFSIYQLNFVERHAPRLRTRLSVVTTARMSARVWRVVDCVGTEHVLVRAIYSHRPMTLARTWHCNG